MPRDDSWMMGALAAQDAYRGDDAQFPPPPEPPLPPPLPPLPPLSVVRNLAQPKPFEEYLREATQPRTPTKDTLLRQLGAGALRGAMPTIGRSPSPFIEDTVAGFDPGTQEHMRGIAEHAIAEVPEPTTPVGRYTRAFGESAINPAHYFGVGPMAGLGWAAGSAIGGETLGHEFKGTAAEPWARAIGASAPFPAWWLAGKGVEALPRNTLGAGGGRVVQPAPGVAPGVAPGSQAWRDLENPAAPYARYAEEYPAAGPPTMMPKDKPKYPGEMYPEKTLTLEAEEFEKARTKIAASMAKKGYDPYFDPNKRGLVDQSKYPPPNVDTSTIRPQRGEAVKKYTDAITSPETRARLDAAIARGEELGGADRWYYMNQLEKEYTKELGPKAGREAFLNEFAAAMGATTSGQRPGPNLMTAHYFEYLRKKGETLPESHQFPTPVGGRRAAVNRRDYLAMADRGGYMGLGKDQPKMHDFSRSMIGDLRNPVMDEQMTAGMLAGHPAELISGARNTAYGMLQDPVREAAAARGVLPGAVQDVAWAGFKGEPGKSMIEIVNEAIERTHRLTGMARSEIVRRGLVRKEIPLYGLGGAMTMGAMGALADQSRIREE